ncbi:TIGR03564 family F420-dependent LLM class oxidoreductase [Pseudofrankia inefficax]|uniref:F420-dependent oxidoreductase n=1 Tax=Pseudofrankia inefficax (strain DSM 45817 / CECT 9037 / DDB 130130 / EuI1c) TaxID=298654 RepID=E3J6J3_PSEI1|nr:TIGR03564 family F420-dependent LLM class oxidoreductase [Pseudofrankia inefficax]ADP80769.1 F420-dependent oxidoreductase [Pseudofrankia inefficax]
MRIGLTGGASTPDKIINQAKKAEAEGFHHLWFASVVQGDPLVSMALAGRETSTIELGTAVLQTYTSHPFLLAQRAASVTAAMGRPGFTLGIGPSHAGHIRDEFGLSYDRPGRNTEEYVRLLTSLLRDGGVDSTGEEWSAHIRPGTVRATEPVPVLLAALSPRLLRVAGEHADGAVLWMAPAKAIAQHVEPRLTAAAKAAGRPAPRIVAGLPVAVHDDETEARAAVNANAVMYASSPAYQRIMAIGGATGPGEAAIVGDEAKVERQLQALLDAGATDIWAQPVPLGADPRASLRRTRELLAGLAG